jgi:hypothetical protein
VSLSLASIDQEAEALANNPTDFAMNTAAVLKEIKDAVVAIARFVVKVAGYPEELGRRTVEDVMTGARQGENPLLLAVRLGWRPSRLDDEAYGDVVEAAGGVDEWPPSDFTPEETTPGDDDRGGGSAMLFGCS